MGWEGCEGPTRQVIESSHMSQLGPRPSLSARIATRIERVCSVAAWWSVPEAVFVVSLFGLYALVGIIAVRVGFYTPDYPFLSLRDPFFNTFGTLTGLTVCQGTGALVIIALMDGVRSVREAISVLAAFIGFGFGAASIRLTVHQTLEFLLEVLRGP